MGRKRRELGVRAEIQDDMVTGSGSLGHHAGYSDIPPKGRHVEEIRSFISNKTHNHHLHLSLLKEMGTVTQKESSEEHTYVAKEKDLPDMRNFQLTLVPTMLASDPVSLIKDKYQKDKENRKLSSGKLESLQTEKEKYSGKPRKDGKECTDNVEKWSKEEKYDYFRLLSKREEDPGKYGETVPEDFKMSCQWKGMENRERDEVQKPPEPTVIDKGVLVEEEKNRCIDNRTLEDG